METLLDRTVGRLNRLPFFSLADYASLNPDVASSGMDLAHHALMHGCAEKRQIFKRGQLARAYGEARLRTSEAKTPDTAVPARLPRSASVLVSSWSAPATKALAGCLVRDLVSQGVATTLEDERSVPDAIPDDAIVVAPQEFFRLGFGPAWRGTALARSALMLNTAPPGSDDFVGALPYLLTCRGVLDLSAQTVDMFARADVPAAEIRPSMPWCETWLKAEDAEHPLVHALPAAAREPTITREDPRPIDVSFIGNHTEWRGECLARIAPEMTGYTTVLRLEAGVAELTERVVLERSGFRIAGHIAARSKLSLQLAGSEIPGLDWFATLRSMAAGAVVVTDRIMPHREFRSGVHFFEDDSRHLPDLIRWLLDDAEGRAAAEAVRSAARAILSDRAGGRAWTAQAARLWRLA